MPTPDTITRGAGQARRSAARLILSVAKYSGLTLAGIILFRAGAAYALTERGYSAVGGEAFALFFSRVLCPVFGRGPGIRQRHEKRLFAGI